MHSFNIWIIFMLLLAADGQDNKFSDNCLPHCKCFSSPYLIIECVGKSLASRTKLLPSHTRKFKYIAQESEINLTAANFSNVIQLEELHIIPDKEDFHGITLNQIDEDHQDVFNPLINLRILRLNIKWRMDKYIPRIFKPLRNLSELDLSNTKKINITNFVSALDVFRDSCELKKLNLWNIFTIGDYKFLNLTAILEPLQNCPLETVNVGYNGLHEIEPGIIQYAPSLKQLVISNNFLQGILNSGLFLEVILHPKLVEADFSKQGFGSLRTRSKRSIRSKPKKLGERLSALFQNVSKACFERVAENVCYRFHNVCAGLDKSLLDQNHDMVCSILKAIAPKMWGGIPCHYIPYFSELADKSCAGCIVMPTTGNLRKVRFNEFNVYEGERIDVYFKKKPKCFHRNTSLEYIDMSDNREHGYPDTSTAIQSSPVRGLQSLQVIEISNLGLTTIHPMMTRNMPNLRKIDVSKNSLSFNDSNLEENLKYCSNLVKLNLAFNRIVKIPWDAFSSMHKLETLNISNNQMILFMVRMTGLFNLRTLDLRNNGIILFHRDTTADLNAIAMQHPPKTVDIDLTNNDMVCTCYTHDFLNWMLEEKHPAIQFRNKDKYKCMNILAYRVNLDTITMEAIRAECRGPALYLAITICSTVFSCAAVFAGIVYVYRKRWWFRYQYYLGKQLWRHHQHKQTLAAPFMYDVFISYNQRDQAWVDEVLQPTLEDEHGLKLCLHLRDFELGLVITEQIISAIENSRKTLLILSPNFLASTWCQWEMQMAQHKLFTTGKDVLLLALLKPLPKVGISCTLKLLMEQKTYIEWTEDEYGQKMFWAKLLDVIEAPREEPFDVEYHQVDVPEERQSLLDKL